MSCWRLRPSSSLMVDLGVAAPRRVGRCTGGPTFRLTMAAVLVVCDRTICEPAQNLRRKGEAQLLQKKIRRWSRAECQQG